MTLECLRSVFAETKDAKFEVIVVDNDSTDGSAAAIEKEFGSRIILVCSEENLGFAAGNNLAAGKARGEYLLLLNPDTLVIDGAIDKLVRKSLERPQSGIWGGRTEFADGSLNPASCWQRQTTWSLLSQALGLTVIGRTSSIFNPEAIGGWKRDSERKVDIVSGCFLLIKKKLWDDLQGFNEAFFMYGEEADLCLRSKRLGADPVIFPEATIIHHGGASERVRADKLVRLLRAKRLLIEKHFSPESVSLGKSLLFCWPLSRYWMHSILALIGRQKSSDVRVAWGEVVKRKNEWTT